MVSGGGNVSSLGTVNFEVGSGAPAAGPAQTGVPVTLVSHWHSLGLVSIYEIRIMTPASSLPPGGRGGVGGT